MRIGGEHEAGGKKARADADPEPQARVVQRAAHGREQRDHAAGNRRHRHPDDRDFVIGGVRPDRRRDGRHEQRDGADAEGEPEGRGQGRRVFAFDRPAQTDGGEDRRQRRHHLQPDRDRQRGRKPAERGEEPGVAAPGRGRDRGHQQDKLQVVMIDRARMEMNEHRPRHRDQKHRGQGRRDPRGFSREALGEQAGESERGQKQKDRPQGRGRPFGIRAARERRENLDQEGDRQCRRRATSASPRPPADRAGIA